MRRNQRTYICAFFLGAAIAVAPGAMAQDRGDRDRGGRADDRDHRDDHGRGGDARDHRNERPDYHFRAEDGQRFASHYRGNVEQVRKHPDRRHHIRAGEPLPSDFRGHLKAVPQSYYQYVPPPPPGYRLGYYDGYVVAYNPTTQIVADVLDLVNAAVNH
jgi:Ni/Co efflux regulator RcnB